MPLSIISCLSRQPELPPRLNWQQTPIALDKVVSSIGNSGARVVRLHLGVGREPGRGRVGEVRGQRAQRELGAAGRARVDVRHQAAEVGRQGEPASSSRGVAVQARVRAEPDLMRIHVDRDADHVAGRAVRHVGNAVAEAGGRRDAAVEPHEGDIRVGDRVGLGFMLQSK